MKNIYYASSKLEQTTFKINHKDSNRITEM